MREPLGVVAPPTLPRPLGDSHGVRGSGELLFVAGQIGCDQDGSLPSQELVPQFARALENVLEVVAAAGGRPEQIARLTLYVTSLAEYRAAREALGHAWRLRMGRHYPAMTLLEVKGLLDPRAKVEIEATALL
jgi:enamine deaminase RidA (YjgF/YER057c/UK114 family)